MLCFPELVKSSWQANNPTLENVKELIVRQCQLEVTNMFRLRGASEPYHCPLHHEEVRDGTFSLP